MSSQASALAAPPVAEFPNIAPKCPAGHELSSKNVAGTRLFGSWKKCSGCDAALKAGEIRHSCKPCAYHLCVSCHAAVREALLWSDITITIYRAARPGFSEDTFQVQLERCATAGALKGKISSLYGVAPQAQVLRRDADGEPLAEAEPIACDDGDVLHLTLTDPLAAMLMSGPGGPQSGNLVTGMTQAMGSMLAPLSGLVDAFAGAMEAVTHEQRAKQDILDRTTYALTFVMPGSGSQSERRCILEVSAVARVADVLEMVKLEFDAESVPLTLSFAGETLPHGLPMHRFGLGNGDVVMALPSGVPASTLSSAAGSQDARQANGEIVSM